MGYASVLESSWDSAKGLDQGLLPVVTVDKIADQHVQEDDENCSQGVEEEEQLRLARITLGQAAAQPSNEV